MLTSALWTRQRSTDISAHPPQITPVMPLQLFLCPPNSSDLPLFFLKLSESSAAVQQCEQLIVLAQSQSLHNLLLGLHLFTINAINAFFPWQIIHGPLANHTCW